MEEERQSRIQSQRQKGRAARTREQKWEKEADGTSQPNTLDSLGSVRGRSPFCRRGCTNRLSWDGPNRQPTRRSHLQSHPPSSGCRPPTVGSTTPTHSARYQRRSHRRLRNLSTFPTISSLRFILSLSFLLLVLLFFLLHSSSFISRLYFFFY